MARLERQRLEIVTGEAIDEADEGWFCERVLGAARLSENELAFYCRRTPRVPQEGQRFLLKIA